jgi:hypothetical protein
MDLQWKGSWRIACRHLRVAPGQGEGKVRERGSNGGEEGGGHTQKGGREATAAAVQLGKGRGVERCRCPCSMAPLSTWGLGRSIR